MFPVHLIAHAIAHRKATAGGLPLDRPTYEWALQAQAKRLLADAMSGRLRVCDQNGSPVQATEFLASRNADGFDVEVLDQSGQSRNEQLTAILALQTTARWAQEWALDRGDEIVVIADAEWIDHRGVMRPSGDFNRLGHGPAANDSAEASVPPSADVPSGQATSIQARESEQVRQDRRLDRLIALGGVCDAAGNWRIYGGCLKQISQEEKDARRKPFDPKRISEDIKAAARRRCRAETPPWVNRLR